MPRKIEGIAISTIEPSSVASSTPSVTLDSAIHLYESRAPAVGRGAVAVATSPTLATLRSRKDQFGGARAFYLDGPASRPGAAAARSRTLARGARTPSSGPAAAPR